MLPFCDAHLHILPVALPGLSPLIKRVFLNSTGKNDIADILSFSIEDCELLPFVGLHPWEIPEQNPAVLNLAGLLEQNPGTGVGECGLDYSRNYKQFRDKQIAGFIYQLELAQRFSRPVSVHCVRAWGTMLEFLSDFSASGLPFILHSFYGPCETLRKLIDAGAYISLSQLSLRNPEKSSCVIREIPDDRLLIETDLLAGGNGFSPENHFNILLNNYKTVAEIRGVPFEELVYGVYDNGKVFTDRKTDWKR